MPEVHRFWYSSPLICNTHFLGQNRLIPDYLDLQRPKFHVFYQPLNLGQTLILNIIQVASIRLEIVQNKTQFLASLGGVDGLDRVGQLCQFETAVEVHIAGIGIHAVAHASAFMLHVKVLNFMALAFQVISQFENVGFTTAIRVEKFVNH